jgi:hypothetical protein
MPRFLVTDRPELWRRVEFSLLRREEVELVLARDRAELARRVRTEVFDAILVEAGSGDARDAEQALEGSGVASGPAMRLVEWGADADESEIAKLLGLECRKPGRTSRRLVVESEGFTALTKDASRHGLFIIDAPDLEPGARVHARLRAPGAGPSVQVVLEVVRRVCAAEGGHHLRGLGVRMVPLSPEDVRCLDRWLGDPAA